MSRRNANDLVRPVRWVYSAHPRAVVHLLARTRRHRPDSTCTHALCGRFLTGKYTVIEFADYPHDGIEPRRFCPHCLRIAPGEVERPAYSATDKALRDRHLQPARLRAGQAVHLTYLPFGPADPTRWALCGRPFVPVVEQRFVVTPNEPTCARCLVIFGRRQWTAQKAVTL